MNNNKNSTTMKTTITHKFRLAVMDGILVGTATIEASIYFRHGEFFGYDWEVTELEGCTIAGLLKADYGGAPCVVDAVESIVNVWADDYLQSQKEQETGPCPDEYYDQKREDERSN